MLILFLSLSALEETFCSLTWKSLYNTGHWCFLQIFLSPFISWFHRYLDHFIWWESWISSATLGFLENDYLMMLYYCCCESRFLLLHRASNCVSCHLFWHCLFCYQCTKAKHFKSFSSQNNSPKDPVWKLTLISCLEKYKC